MLELNMYFNHLSLKLTLLALLAAHWTACTPDDAPTGDTTPTVLPCHPDDLSGCSGDLSHVENLQFTRAQLVAAPGAVFAPRYPVDVELQVEIEAQPFDSQIVIGLENQNRTAFCKLGALNFAHQDHVLKASAEEEMLQLLGSIPPASSNDDCSETRACASPAELCLEAREYFGLNDAGSEFSFLDDLPSHVCIHEAQLEEAEQSAPSGEDEQDVHGFERGTYTLTERFVVPEECSALVGEDLQVWTVFDPWFRTSFHADKAWTHHEHTADSSWDTYFYTNASHFIEVEGNVPQLVENPGIRYHIENITLGSSVVHVEPSREFDHQWIASATANVFGMSAHEGDPIPEAHATWYFSLRPSGAAESEALLLSLVSQNEDHSRHLAPTPNAEQNLIFHLDVSQEIQAELYTGGAWANETYFTIEGCADYVDDSSDHEATSCATSQFILNRGVAPHATDGTAGGAEAGCSESDVKAYQAVLKQKESSFENLKISSEFAYPVEGFGNLAGTISNTNGCGLQYDSDAGEPSDISPAEHLAKFDCAIVGDPIVIEDEHHAGEPTHMTSGEKKIYAKIGGKKCGLQWHSQAEEPSLLQVSEHVAKFDCDGHNNGDPLTIEKISDTNYAIYAVIGGFKCGLQWHGSAGGIDTITSEEHVAKFDCGSVNNADPVILNVKRNTKAVLDHWLKAEERDRNFRRFAHYMASGNSSDLAGLSPASILAMAAIRPTLTSIGMFLKQNDEGIWVLNKAELYTSYRNLLQASLAGYYAGQAAALESDLSFAGFHLTGDASSFQGPQRFEPTSDGTLNFSVQENFEREDKLIEFLIFNAKAQQLMPNLNCGEVAKDWVQGNRLGSLVDDYNFQKNMGSTVRFENEFGLANGVYSHPQCNGDACPFRVEARIKGSSLVKASFLPSDITLLFAEAGGVIYSAGVGSHSFFTLEALNDTIVDSEWALASEFALPQPGQFSKGQEFCKNFGIPVIDLGINVCVEASATIGMEVSNLTLSAVGAGGKLEGTLSPFVSSAASASAGLDIGIAEVSVKGTFDPLVGIEFPVVPSLSWDPVLNPTTHALDITTTAELKLQYLMKYLSGQLDLHYWVIFTSPGTTHLIEKTAPYTIPSSGVPGNLIAPLHTTTTKSFQLSLH